MDLSTDESSMPPPQDVSLMEQLLSDAMLERILSMAALIDKFRLMSVNKRWCKVCQSLLSQQQRLHIVYSPDDAESEEEEQEKNERMIMEKYHASITLSFNSVSKRHARKSMKHLSGVTFLSGNDNLDACTFAIIGKIIKRNAAHLQQLLLKTYCGPWICKRPLPLLQRLLVRHSPLLQHVKVKTWHLSRRL